MDVKLAVLKLWVRTNSRINYTTITIRDKLLRNLPPASMWNKYPSQKLYIGSVLARESFFRLMKIVLWMLRRAWIQFGSTDCLSWSLHHDSVYHSVQSAEEQVHYRHWLSQLRSTRFLLNNMDPFFNKQAHQDSSIRKQIARFPSLHEQSTVCYRFKAITIN
jgi:hypothetical protein